MGVQVARPDGKPDLLGLKVLDEPAAIQSDPAVLTMQLRQSSKQVGRCNRPIANDTSSTALQSACVMLAKATS